MGKRIRTQRRGEGKHRYTAPSHRFKTDAKYRDGEVRGVVVDLEKDPSKYGIVMKIEWEDGETILIDELLTPDSSRFWPAENYEPGTAPESLDKEYLRQYLLKSGWNREPPAPELPEEVIMETSRRYLEIYKKLTGRKLDV